MEKVLDGEIYTLRYTGLTFSVLQQLSFFANFLNTCLLPWDISLQFKICHLKNIFCMFIAQLLGVWEGTPTIVGESSRHRREFLSFRQQAAQQGEPVIEAHTYSSTILEAGAGGSSFKDSLITWRDPVTEKKKKRNVIKQDRCSLLKWLTGGHLSPTKIGRTGASVLLCLESRL